MSIYDLHSFNYIDSFALNPMIGVVLLVGVFIMFNALYFTPTLIAFHKGHRNRWVIFALNFALGMTGLIWVLLIIWALEKIDAPTHKTWDSDR